MGVDLIAKGKLNKTYLGLFRDIWMLIKAHYLHFDSDRNVLPANTYGRFFPEMFANPTKYIVQQPEMREVIQKLRDQGKVLFVGTNSHWEYMELIMSTTLGPDWRNFFDFVFAFCRKPHFFSTENPMYIMDKSIKDFNGTEVKSADELKPDSSITYLQGNAKLLEGHLKTKLGKDKVSIVFHGD